MPSSLRRELRLPLTDLLPLSAGMCSSIDANVFAVDHRRRLQIEQSIYDFGDLNQSWHRVQLFQDLLVVVGVHRRVNNTRRNRIEPNSIGHELHSQRAAESGN